jgi:hypothetical protein
MRFQGTSPLALLCVLTAATATGAEHDAAPELADISVLTPAMEGHFISGSFDALGYVPYVGGLASGIVKLNSNANARRLRRLAAAERYDPVPAIADRVVDALEEAGYTAVHEPIPRRPAGSVQSLSWSDLPERPHGKLFLDVNIRWIGLCTGHGYFKYRAAISIGWRLLGPRQEIVEPTRELVYVHAPPLKKSTKPAATDAKARPAESPYPQVEVSESCGFDNMDEAEKNPLRLWGCFGEAYDAAIERLVIDLKRLRPPAIPVTASVDTPSGISTR